MIQQKEGAKGRSFAATCVGVATADGLWASGGKTIRPVWAVFAGSEGELRPFVTNLRLGRKAERLSNFRSRGGDEERLEFLKTVGYQITWQRESEGAIATLFHPELFRLDPGMVDPAGIQFVLLVPADWSAAQAVEVTPAVDHVRALAPKVDPSFLQRLVPTAYLFAAYLDRRTRCPLVADGRFYLQLLIAALDHGLASLPGNCARYDSHRSEWGHDGRHGFNLEVGGERYCRDSIETIGLRHAISFSAAHDVFEVFLAEQVALFFDHRATALAVTPP